MDQHLLKPPVGSKRPRKRVGRGDSSGHGTYSTRGLKGQKARSGGGVRPGFEGGQIPLVRRLGHKRGFKNALRIEFAPVNLRDLTRHFAAGATVDGQALAALRLIDHAGAQFKVLGMGTLPHALTVRAPRLSESAKAAITGAGGSFEELAPAAHKIRNRIHRRAAAAAAAVAPRGDA
jgi:large subunit ribosomal protein L15